MEGGLDVERSGRGSDVLLLHSLLTDRSAFAALQDRLATERRVWLVNMPGFGASAPATPLAGYADRIAALFDGGDPPRRPDVIGNGLGGFVALLMAARHGARLGRIVLLGSVIAFPEAGRAAFAALARKVEEGGMAAVADAAMQRLFPAEYIAAHPRTVAERRAVFLGLDPQVFAAAARSLTTLDLSTDLSAIRNPVLVVAGEKDEATPPALGRALADRLSDARFVELPGAGHAPHIQALDALLAAIGPFLGLAER